MTGEYGLQCKRIKNCKSLDQTERASLQVKEAIGQDGTSIDTVDQALAQAEANLVRGRYAEAARSLEQGLSGKSQSLRLPVLFIAIHSDVNAIMQNIYRHCVICRLKQSTTV